MKSKKSIKSLEKQLKKLQKTAKKERKEKELIRQIKELKYRKFIKAREKVRKGAVRLGEGTKKAWAKMKEMEEKNLQKQKRKKAPKEDYLSRLDKTLS